MIKLWEYAIRSAVASNELAEHEGSQVLQCMLDAEVLYEYCYRSLTLELTWSPLSQQVQDGSGSEAKQAKFKRSLSMKFGPAKGSTIFETVRYLLATNQRSSQPHHEICVC